jgi:hypothetical protein
VFEVGGDLDFAAEAGLKGVEGVVAGREDLDGDAPLQVLIDGEVDRLAREMAGRRRGRRLAGSYLTADASIERQTRSA